MPTWHFIHSWTNGTANTFIFLILVGHQENFSWPVDSKLTVLNHFWPRHLLDHVTFWCDGGRNVMFRHMFWSERYYPIVSTVSPTVIRMPRSPCVAHLFICAVAWNLNAPRRWLGRLAKATWPTASRNRICAPRALPPITPVSGRGRDRFWGVT